MTRNTDATREKYINITYPKLKQRAREANRSLVNPQNHKCHATYDAIANHQEYMDYDYLVHDGGRK